MIDRLKQFVESEMRSCSMDIGGILPLYVYRMWGGAVAIGGDALRLRSQQPGAGEALGRTIRRGSLAEAGEPRMLP